MMTRVLLTFLVGLVVSLGALVSGGSGVAWAGNWNLTSGGEKTKNPNRIDLSAYDEFRTLKFEIDGLSYDSYAAYKQGKNLFGFYAKGVLFYGDEICNWKSNITNRKTKSGSFEASCPSGLTVDGQYTYVGNKQGSYGSGTDTKGRSVSYVLGAAWSSSKYEIEQHYLNYFAPKQKAVPAPANTASQSAELKAERQKRIKLEQQLAALEAKQQKQKKTINNDTYSPLITASSRNKDEATSIIFGTVTDDTGVASLTVAGEVVELAADGSFQTQTYVPALGLDIEIVAYDLKGNKASKTLSLNRKATQATLTQTYEKLRPSLGKRGKTNKAALALIVGIETYEYFPSRPAIYADSDAQYFADYAHYKLGVPRGNIITAINAGAEALDIRKAITKITKQSTKDKTDVFVFFAGHGLASDDETEDVYLLPYDGDKDYLDETSLTRGEVFKLVERIKPRSVTVFLDACYSGATRSEDKVLVANKRPVVPLGSEQAVPEGFTVLSAAAANETSMALEEAKHGLFSYYLMRGMEGDADTNQDNKITMNEMRDYVKDKVGRQSDFKQTPQLQGDANRVLVQFQ